MAGLARFLSSLNFTKFHLNPPTFKISFADCFWKSILQLICHSSQQIHSFCALECNFVTEILTLTTSSRKFETATIATSSRKIWNRHRSISVCTFEFWKSAHSNSDSDSSSNFSFDLFAHLLFHNVVFSCSFLSHFHASFPTLRRLNLREPPDCVFHNWPLKLAPSCLEEALISTISAPQRQATILFPIQ